MCLKAEYNFTDMYLPKSKPSKVVILCRLANKTDFSKYIDQFFREFITVEIQEYCVLSCFNKILVSKGNKIFSNNKQMLALIKKYLEFFLPYSLEKMITPSSRVTDRTATY